MTTLQRKVTVTDSAIADAIDALSEAADFLDNYVDVVDGDYGEPAPNRAMRVLTSVDAAIEALERAQRRRAVQELEQRWPRTFFERMRRWLVSAMMG